MMRNEYVSIHTNGVLCQLINVLQGDWISYLLYGIRYTISIWVNTVYRIYNIPAETKPKGWRFKWFCTLGIIEC